MAVCETDLKCVGNNLMVLPVPDPLYTGDGLVTSVQYTCSSLVAFSSISINKHLPYKRGVAGPKMVTGNNYSCKLPT